jgi:uncharacterized membrane protein (UPF0127 family)
VAPSVAPALVCVRNHTRGTLLCSRAMLARSFRERSRGLLGHSKLGADEGMLFEAEPLFPVMWMHTFFMGFPIDIIFLDRANVVMRIQAVLNPWRLSALVFGARKAIELSAGVAAQTKTEIGDLISLEAV